MLAWPSPEPAIYSENSQLTLPVRHPNQEIDRRLTKFKSPEAAKAINPEVITSSDQNLIITHDLANESTTVKVLNDSGEFCS